jgi:uncharacterized protein (DUF1778 family)
MRRREMDNDDLGISNRIHRRKSGDSREKTIGARISAEEERELIAAADREGRNVSEWTREVLLREARRATDDALFTEVVATRMLLVNLLEPMALGKQLTPARITEIMTQVRKGKHNAAREVMQQYTSPEQKES